MDPIQRQQRGIVDRWGDTRIEEALNRSLEQDNLSIHADGAFDDETREAILQLQYRHHLPTTGRIDPATAELLSIEIDASGRFVTDGLGARQAQLGRVEVETRAGLASIGLGVERQNKSVTEVSLLSAERGAVSAEALTYRFEPGAVGNTGAKITGHLAHGEIGMRVLDGKAQARLDGLDINVGAEGRVFEESLALHGKRLQAVAKLEALSAEAGLGSHHSDGSVGPGAKLKAALVGVKTTVAVGEDKANQVMLGAAAGIGASARGGLRDIDGDGYPEGCFEVSIQPLEFGACGEAHLVIDDVDADGRLEIRAKHPMTGEVEHELPFELPTFLKPAYDLYKKTEQALLEESRKSRSQE